MDNIKKNKVGVNWINLIHDMDQWRASAFKVMHLRIAGNAGISWRAAQQLAA
jgi:hypothetical protein